MSAGTLHNKSPQVNEAHLNHIISQRDQLLQILIQKDLAFERLLSKAKNVEIHQHLDLMSSTDKKIHLATEACADDVKNVKEQLDDFDAKRRNSSMNHLVAAKIKCEQLSLECSLLKSLNKSHVNEIDNLKTVNKILQNNFDTLNGRLEQVQSDHQLRLTQLHDANRQLQKSTSDDSTKKRPRPFASASFPESKSKRGRFVNSETTTDKAESDAEHNSSVSDSDHDEDSDNSTDDVVLVE